MESWRIVLIVVVLVVLIPTVRLMNQVKELREQHGMQKELEKKEKQFKIMQGVLIAVFVVALILTMVKVYSPLFGG